jgi:hypothetical protein
MRTCGRFRLRWVDNIERDRRDTGWKDMDWINLAQNRDQRLAVMNMVQEFLD